MFGESRKITGGSQATAPKTYFDYVLQNLIESPECSTMILEFFLA